MRRLWLAVVAFLTLPVSVAAPGATAGEAPPPDAPTGFYFECSSRLVSKRVGTFSRTHKMWLTAEGLRVDDAASTLPTPFATNAPEAPDGPGGGDTLTTVVRFDTGDVWILSHPQKAYLRWSLRSIGPALLEIGQHMRRTVPPRVSRLGQTRTIAGRPCTQHRFLVGKTACSVWVEDESEEAFEAVRSLARDAVRRLGQPHSAGSPVAVGLRGLHGLPREVTIGDPDSLQLTWTVDAFARRSIPAAVLGLPEGFREDIGSKVPAPFYTLMEHVYFLGEAAASYYATSPRMAGRSLLPPDLRLAAPNLVKGFYEGQPGAERYAIFPWTPAMAFYLSPELWCYPLSGRAVNLLSVIGCCYLGGGLKRYPGLTRIELPAN